MKQYMCIGTYTEPILFGTGEIFKGKGKGITICEFEDGEIRPLKELEVRNPSFVCMNEKNKKIYAVNEMKEYCGEFGGGVSQIAYDEKGNMKIESDYNTGGTDPCHIIVSPNNKFISIANFASGSVTIFPLDEKGNIINNKTLFQHEGNSIHPIRQKGPHAHSSIFAPDKNRMYVPDLGIDKVKAYAFDGDKVTVESNADINVESGNGPRFGEFAPNGKHFYLINEIGSKVVHFIYENGNMIQKETVNTLPENFNGDNICSDLHISPNGSYLYASNRGHDSIACFKINEDGSLKFIRRQECGGKTPRNFAIDPLGKYVLVGNQDSDNITVFEIEDDGSLTEKTQCYWGSPVCIRFFKETKF